MKISGFKINKKMLIIIGVIIVIIIISSAIKNKKKEQEMIERENQINNEQSTTIDNSSNSEILDEHSALQAQLRERYGNPPEGFEWSEDGSLISLGNSDLNAEEVMYSYIRALSILDFSTAQRMSSNSQVYSKYSSFYEDVNDSDYYSEFLRKQFKQSLVSIEILDVTDTAVLADGTKYITINLNVLDLTDKNFWEKDRQKIFDTLRVYSETESDSIKANKYVYDYVYNSYLNGSIGKRKVTIELVIGKTTGGNWLVTNDSELYRVLAYQEGVDVAKYIISEYSEWYTDTKDDELNSNNN